jgi:AraC-like DNA-binding protein
VQLGMVPHRPRVGAVLRVVGFAEQTGGPVQRAELPSGTVPIILTFGDELRISSAAGSGRYTSFLAGPHQIPVDTTHDGTLRCVQVDLAPLGAYRLLGPRLAELRDAVVPVGEVLGPTWADLGERLADLSGWPERFALLDDVLARTAGDGPEPDPEVRWAWQRLAHEHGRVPVGRLAEEIGWSRRHFTARFRQQTGLTPKEAARVLRFSRAYRLLAAGRAASISEVAAQAGYADHSHLIREFHRMAGTAPSRLPTGDHRSPSVHPDLLAQGA